MLNQSYTVHSCHITPPLISCPGNGHTHTHTDTHTHTHTHTETYMHTDFLTLADKSNFKKPVDHAPACGQHIESGL